MEKQEFNHIPVLLNEVLNGLNIRKNCTYIDCTLGGAGHAREILRKLDNTGYLYGFDQDSYAISRAEEKLQSIGSNFTIIKSNFSHLADEISLLGISKVDGILYDLGVSSFQFDIADRGFSYNKDAKLDMRMNQDQELDAYKIVNSYSLDELKKIFYEYGEEKFGYNIAKQIIRARDVKPIYSTFELVEIIKKAIPAAARRTGGHPAKKVFQALRIEVNDELNVFEKSLRSALDLLNSQGRIAVLTFHSLEDRICKQVFKEKVEVNTLRGLPIKESDIKREFKLITKKPITATETELNNNNRAHSAKLRIIEKL